MNVEQAFFVALSVGICIGVSLGIPIGRKQKPWSDLDPSEKRVRKLVIGAGCLTLAAGAVTAVLY